MRDNNCLSALDSTFSLACSDASSCISSSSLPSFFAASSATTDSLSSSYLSSCPSSLLASKTEDQDNGVSFKDLGVCDELCESCARLGYKFPTEIQKKAIPYALQGRDIIGIAETGSGKTVAFALPILQDLLVDLKRIYAVVLAPTRELCVQISENFNALGSLISLEVCSIVGGLDMVVQAINLAKKPHVIVASPGRLLDHVSNTKGFSLKTVKYVVMDEADKLLSLDFEDSLNKLLAELPSNRRTYLFSATMTSKVSKLQRASLNKPVKVEVSSCYDTAKNLVQNFILIPYKYKWSYAYAILNLFQKHLCIVFVNTCLTAKKLAIFLRHLSFSSVCLNGHMTQPQRLGALNVFKSGKRNILVATEVGSRGLDIPNVDLVLNFDLSLNSKDYIHRVGRTARAGKSGRAISIVTQYDVEAFQRIEFSLNKKLEEFLDLDEETVMKWHERCMEALRTAELELKENEEDKVSTGKKRKQINRGSFRTKRR